MLDVLLRVVVLFGVMDDDPAVGIGAKRTTDEPIGLPNQQAKK